MFYVYFRGVSYASASDVKRRTLEEAIAAGDAGSEHFKAGTPFDIYEESGAVAWVWEEQPVGDPRTGKYLILAIGPAGQTSDFMVQAYSEEDARARANLAAGWRIAHII